MRASFHSGIPTVYGQAPEIARVLSERLGTRGDALLTMKAAAVLPELGGVVSVKMMRAAIASGSLKAVQPGGPGGIVYVTRDAIKKWMEACLVAPTPRTFGSGPRATGETASSAREPSGSSSIDQRKSAQDAALRIARALSKR